MGPFYSTTNTSPNSSISSHIFLRISFYFLVPCPARPTSHDCVYVCVLYGVEGVYVDGHVPSFCCVGPVAVVSTCWYWPPAAYAAGYVATTTTINTTLLLSPSSHTTPTATTQPQDPSRNHNATTCYNELSYEEFMAYKGSILAQYLRPEYYM